MKSKANQINTEVYEFDKFRLVPSQKLLLRDGETLSLPPKIFEVLIVLVENNGDLIEKDELLNRVWEDTFVEEATLAKAVSRLRKALEQNAENKYIETIAKSGYRFVAPVRVFDSNEKEKPTETSVRDRGRENANSRTRFSDLRTQVLAVLGLLAIVLLMVSVIWNYRGSSESSLSNVKSIAVLPFKSLGEKKEDKALELGMADALIIKLSNIKEVQIRPTSSITKYAERKDLDIAKIGQDLNVDAVLDGTIQEEDGKLRVTVQLLDSEDETSLWSEKFDAVSTNIFSLQDNISARIAQSFTSKLTNTEKQQLSKHYTENIEAYEAYIKGRYLWSKRKPADLKASLEFFEKAVEIDPNYALAYTGIADCYQLFAEYRIIPNRDGFEKARQAANKALEIDETLAEAHTSLGYTLAFYDWNFKAAGIEFRRAIELKPNYATARQWFAEYLMSMGRFDEAYSELEKARKLDPLSLAIGANFASYYYIKRDYDKTLEEAKKLKDIDSKFAWVYIAEFMAYSGKNMEKESIKSYIDMSKAFNMFSEAELIELNDVYENKGWEPFWQKQIEILDRNKSQFRYSPWNYVGPYIRIKNKDQAIKYLDLSYKERIRWVITIKYSPEYDSLRSDPRFQKIVEKIGVE